jgi:hypothetical protein
MKTTLFSISNKGPELILADHYHPKDLHHLYESSTYEILALTLGEQHSQKNSAIF